MGNTDQRLGALPNRAAEQIHDTVFRCHEMYVSSTGHHAGALIETDGNTADRVVLGR